MDIFHLHKLLHELRDQLVDDSKLIGAAGRRQRRRELLGRVQSIIDAGAGNIAPADIVTAARQLYSEDARMHIDDHAPWRRDVEGVWIGAWVFAGVDADTYEGIDPARLAASIVALPSLAREVFTLRCRYGLDYASIAARLSVSEETVRRELAAALVALDLALSGPTGENVSPIA